MVASADAHHSAAARPDAPLYDPYKSLFLRYRGTVLQLCWKRCVVASLAAIPLCFLWDEIRRATDKGTHPWETRLARHLFNDSADFFTMSSGILTFILGWFNTTVYNRWWTLRDLAGRVIGRSVDTAVMFSAYLKRGRNVEAVREDLLRLLALAHRVTYFHTSRSGLRVEELLAEGLLKAGSAEVAVLEAAAAQRVALYSVVYGWLISRLEEALVDGEVDVDDRYWSTLTLSVQGNVTMMRGAAADLMMYLNQPVPLTYTHLLEVTVNIYGLVAAFGLVARFHWLAPPIVFIVLLFFHGFYKLGIHMLDPFREENPFVGFDTSKFYTDAVSNCNGVGDMVPASRYAKVSAEREAQQSSSELRKHADDSRLYRRGK